MELAGPAGNDEVMIASEDAAIRAPARPCTARAPISNPRSGRDAARQRGEPEQDQRHDEHPALPEVIGRAAAEHQEAREGDRVRVDDPLQVGRGEAEARLDRGQRDVDDAQVEDDHELGHAADGQQPPEREPSPRPIERDCAAPGLAGASMLMSARSSVHVSLGSALATWRRIGPSEAPRTPG